MLSQIDKILDDISVLLRENSEHLSECVKRLLEVMEYDNPYTSTALMEKLGLKSKEGFRRNYLRANECSGCLSSKKPHLTVPAQ